MSALKKYQQMIWKIRNSYLINFNKFMMLLKIIKTETKKEEERLANAYVSNIYLDPEVRGYFK